MRYEEFKSAVIRAAKETGLKDYELYYVNSESLSVGAFGHEINEFSSSTEGGVCFRNSRNGRNRSSIVTPAITATSRAACVFIRLSSPVFP